MPENDITELQTLDIYQLTEDQYAELLESSEFDQNALYMTPASNEGMWHGDEVGSLTTLYGDSAKTEALYPRTKVSAISDRNNTSLEELLQNLDTDLVNLGTIADLNLSGVAETTYIGMTRSDTLNKPDGATSAFVIFESVTPNYGRIMYYSDAGIYTRHKESGTWSGWNTIIRNNPSYSNATLNSSYFSGGNVRYCKTGNIVSVNIQDATLKTAVGSGIVTNIITGLPAPVKSGESILLQQFGTDQSWRVALIGDGSIQSHYDAQSASGSQWYGNFTYVTKEA